MQFRMSLLISNRITDSLDSFNNESPLCVDQRCSTVLLMALIRTIFICETEYKQTVLFLK